MKKLLTISVIVICLNANATTYYISNSGNDSNSGTSTSSSWLTLTNVNSTPFVAGDSILFQSGSTQYGSIIISHSGSVGNPIFYGVYGIGAAPIITGFTTVPAWTNLGSNLWQSAGTVSALSYTNIVAINGLNIPMGRTALMNYQSHSGSTTITSSSLTGTPNWTGAELVMRNEQWIIDRNSITAQSGGTLTYTTTSGYNGIDGQQFFIQNDVRTLDAQNEWYYNPLTGKLNIYSTISPTNVQIATIDTLVFIGSSSVNRNYVTFTGLVFQGAGKAAFSLEQARHITITNCAFLNMGQDGIKGTNFGSSTTNVITFCSFNKINNNAINLVGASFDHTTISNNSLINVASVMGMGQSSDRTYSAVLSDADNDIIAYNTLDSIGYVGIQFNGNTTVVNNNFISRAMLTKTDGGAIYTYNGSNATFTGRVVKNNIITNSATASGIYMDDNTNGVEVDSNTVQGCDYGIFLHGNRNMNVHDNTSYDNAIGQMLVKDKNGMLFSGISIKNNILFAKTASQLALALTFTTTDSSLSFLTSDSNYFARPVYDSLTFLTWKQGGGQSYPGTYRTFANWQGYTGQDAHSHKSPKTITDVNDLIFEYNPTSVNKTIIFGGNYIDVKNVSYNGTITLAPYTSAVLIRNGVNNGCNCN